MRSCSKNSSAGHTSEPIYGNFVLSWSGPTLNFHCVELERAFCIPRLVNKYALFLGEDVVLLIPVNSLWHKRIVVWLTAEKSDIPLMHYIASALDWSFYVHPDCIPQEDTPFVHQTYRTWWKISIAHDTGHFLLPSGAAEVDTVWAWRCTRRRRRPRAFFADEDALDGAIVLGLSPLIKMHWMAASSSSFLHWWVRFQN